MFSEYLDDYYKSKIGVKEICDIIGSSPTTFRRWLKRNDLIPRQKYMEQIDTGVEELNQVLKQRYSSIVNRCNGKTTDYYGKYKGKPYIPVYEWVKFCNNHKEKLLEMWEVYEVNDRDMRYSISIDRIDNDKGYTLENIQFTTHGFNSWKRNLNPVRVTHEGEVEYFMTCEDASRHYGLRRQAMGEILAEKAYHNSAYEVSPITVSEVLTANQMTSEQDYYQQLLLEDRDWDERKRQRN